MFDRFFSSNNVLWYAMGKIFDVFILNTLLLLCSVPLFTIGPAVTGFYYALVNMVRDEEISVSREFFRSFRRNFRQAVKLGVPMTLLLLFLWIDIRMCQAAGTGIYTFFMVFFFIVLLFTAFTCVYAFVLLAKFEKSNKEILIWAFTMSLSHKGTTLLILLMAVLGAWFTHIIPGLLFIIFGLEGMFQASMIVKILEPLLPDRYRPTEDLPPIFLNDPASETKTSTENTEDPRL